MKLRDLIVENAHKDLTKALMVKFPDRSEYINQEYTWAKNALKKSDRIVWYMKIIRSLVEHNTVTPNILGSYRYSTIEKFREELLHFFGYEIPEIQNYQFRNQTISQVFTDFGTAEQNYQARQQSAHPVVKIQAGDHVLIEFNDGYKWWWVDRAYCSDEGASGGHCGNVTGQYQKDQRILSFRTPDNRVLLTFILEPKGTLGEMKARNNRKPSERLHKYIIALLKLDLVKGITSGGYAPHMNFSMFDLKPEQQEYFLKNKPNLIFSQLEATPVEILKASEVIKKDELCRRTATDNQPGLSVVMKPNPSDEDWMQAFKYDYSLVLYAPQTIPNYENWLIRGLEYNTAVKLARAPDAISRSRHYLELILRNSYEETAIGGVNPNLKFYPELAAIAINRSPDSWFYVDPEHKKSPKLAELAASKGVYIDQIPEEARTRQIYLYAVGFYPGILERDLVPKQFIDDDLLLAAVTGPNTRHEWDNHNADIFDTASERVKLELVKRFPRAIGALTTSTETLRLAAYGRDASVVRYTLNQGHFPSKAEQEVIHREDNWTYRRLPFFYSGAQNNLRWWTEEAEIEIANIEKSLRTNYKYIKIYKEIIEKPGHEEIHDTIKREIKTMRQHIIDLNTKLENRKRYLKQRQRQSRNLKKGFEAVGFVYETDDPDENIF